MTRLHLELLASTLPKGTRVWLRDSISALREAGAEMRVIPTGRRVGRVYDTATLVIGDVEFSCVSASRTVRWEDIEQEEKAS